MSRSFSIAWKSIPYLDIIAEIKEHLQNGVNYVNEGGKRLVRCTKGYRDIEIDPHHKQAQGKYQSRYGSSQGNPHSFILSQGRRKRKNAIDLDIEEEEARGQNV